MENTPDAPDTHCANPLALIVTAVVVPPFWSAAPQFAGSGVTVIGEVL